MDEISNIAISLAIDGFKHHFKLRSALMAANQMDMV